MLLALFVVSAAALTDPSRDPSTGDAVVRGVLLDTTSKPVNNAHVELWTRTQDSSEPTARGWHQRSEVSTPAHGKLEIGHVEPGSCMLVARFEGTTSQEFIIGRFTVAAGETKDLGELHPEGKEHSFRLAILDPAGADITELVVKSDGIERSKLVRFDLVHRATADDPPLSWSFFRPCGLQVTVRGLDALGDGWELQPWTDEKRLLPAELRIFGTMRPIAKIGASHADPASLDLFTSRARVVKVEFEVPGNVTVGSSNPVELSVVKPDSSVTNQQDGPVRLAVVDRVGNLRVFHMRTRDPMLYTNIVSLTPGLYQLYALYSFDDVLESDQVFGTAIQTVEITDGKDVDRVHVSLKSGVTVTGTARVTSAFHDPHERRALSAQFAGLVPPRTLLTPEESETLLIDVPLGDDGAFRIDSLPPGGSFSIGLPGLLHTEHSKTLVVPLESGNVGEIVID